MPLPEMQRSPQKNTRNNNKKVIGGVAMKIKKKMRIGVLGGTFDPIHIGHLMLADQAVHQEGLAKILFVPSYRPPHKAEGSFSAVEDRIEMIRRAISGHDRFELSTVERLIPGKGYTYKTLELLKQEYGPDVEFSFVVGSDVLEDLVNFMNAEALLGSCSFICAVRPGDDHGTILKLADHLTRAYRADVRMIRFFEIGISSSLIRDKIGTGESVRYLLPDSVLAYIVQRQLYHR